MWHKIEKNDSVIRNASKGDHLRFIGDSGDLIGDIEETYLILEIYNEIIEYVSVKNEKVKIKEINRFETGNWYFKKTL